MKRNLSPLSFAIATLVFGIASASAGPSDRIVVANTSCSSFQATCAARCKQRAPQDANCVSDHCTPKLNACRSSGCWQEGKMYGGKESCNLKKS